MLSVLKLLWTIYVLHITYTVYKMFHEISLFVWKCITFINIKSFISVTLKKTVVLYVLINWGYV
jgi:hypothetical protein